MTVIPDEKKAFIDEFLQQPLIARLATADLSGQPHVVPVWYAWDGECLWISSFSDTFKIKVLKNNPRAAICIDVANGSTKAVIFEGRVELLKEPKDFLRQQFHWIYERYMGAEGVKAERPQSWIEDPLNVLIKLVPEKVFSWNW